MEKIKLNGLASVLKKFEDTYDLSVYGKNWGIAQGGYDLNWELYYNRQPIAQCTAPYNEVSIWGVSEKDEKRLFNKIKEVYDYVRECTDD